MQVGELCPSRKPDLAKYFPCLDLLAFSDLDRAFFHMAILGLPSVAMTDDDPIPAILAIDGCGGLL